ncbi:MAG TPA: HAD family hydrolase [Methanosphaera sp.]|nr:HAD family hydrolase [Methanosphaera sp.]
MKSIVFDNAGTILQRVTALKDMSSNNIIFDTNTIGIVNKKEDSLILVFQTPTKKLINLNCKIVDYLRDNMQSVDIAYSKKKITKKQVIDALEHDNSTFKDLADTAFSLIDTYDIEICSGSALIVDILNRKIDYVYTAGGVFFEGTKSLFKQLHDMKMPIYIASGDNRHSLLKIASILNVPDANVYHTCNIACKEKVVSNLQNEYSHVIMVGNHTNDILAIKKADTGILTIQQGEELPDNLIQTADYVIKNINDVLKIVKK